MRTTYIGRACPCQGPAASVAGDATPRSTIETSFVRHAVCDTLLSRAASLGSCVMIFVRYPTRRISESQLKVKCGSGYPMQTLQATATCRRQILHRVTTLFNGLIRSVIDASILNAWPCVANPGVGFPLLLLCFVAVARRSIQYLVSVFNVEVPVAKLWRSAARPDLASEACITWAQD
jgi:hypothetical protein